MDRQWWWWLAAAGALALVVLLLTVRERRAVRRAVRLAVEEHAPALARRRAQLVRVDDYGVEIDKAWRREMRHFFDNALLPRLRPPHQRDALAREDEILALIDATARERGVAVAKATARPPVGTSGADFEQRCREALAGAGWSARLTPATGDQGADIVAERGGTTVVLQCKRYARPVGNKAVQEVAAARTYYGADLAAVVSNSDYTEAARRLAHRNEVLLLHVDDLHDLDARLGLPAR